MQKETFKNQKSEVLKTFLTKILGKFISFTSYHLEIRNGHKGLIDMTIGVLFRKLISRDTRKSLFQTYIKTK